MEIKSKNRQADRQAGNKTNLAPDATLDMPRRVAARKAYDALELSAALRAVTAKARGRCERRSQRPAAAGTTTSDGEGSAGGGGGGLGAYMHTEEV